MLTLDNLVKVLQQASEVNKANENLTRRIKQLEHDVMSLNMEKQNNVLYKANKDLVEENHKLNEENVALREKNKSLQKQNGLNQHYITSLMNWITHKHAYIPESLQKAINENNPV
jgi:dsDNA-specific endonuclease/ATPase MutS2